MIDDTEKTNLKKERKSALKVLGIIVGFIVVANIVGRYLLIPTLIRQKTAEIHHKAEGLVGVASPQFTLNGEDGSPVTDATLLGSVYVLDNEPTNIAKLNSFAQRHSNDGVKIYAVYPYDLAHDYGHTYVYQPSFIQAFHSRVAGGQILTFSDEKALPVTLQSTGSETTVVGRDGKIVNILFDGNYDGGIEDAVKSALAKK